MQDVQKNEHHNFLSKALKKGKSVGKHLRNLFNRNKL